jgi:hypothetical protein
MLLHTSNTKHARSRHYGIPPCESSCQEIDVAPLYFTKNPLHPEKCDAAE